MNDGGPVNEGLEGTLFPNGDTSHPMFALAGGKYLAYCVS